MAIHCHYRLLIGQNDRFWPDSIVESMLISRSVQRGDQIRMGNRRHEIAQPYNILCFRGGFVHDSATFSDYFFQRRRTSTWKGRGDAGKDINSLPALGELFIVRSSARQDRGRQNMEEKGGRAANVAGISDDIGYPFSRWIRTDAQE